jgi:O-antigen biosynthesis protein
VKYTGERVIPEEEFCGPKTNIYKEHVARYQFASKYTKSKKVLDVACGSGYGSEILSESGADYVIGCDISKESIEYAQKHYQKDNIKFVTNDIKKLNFNDEEFDCVISFETLEHIKDQKLVISELKRVLKKDGILIISTPNLESRTNSEENSNCFHEKELTVIEFKELLTEYFPKFDLFSQRLIIEINLCKKFIRDLILKSVKWDSKKIYTKIFPQKFYNSVYNVIDDTDGDYQPISYNSAQKPRILIGVCYK